MFYIIRQNVRRNITLTVYYSIVVGRAAGVTVWASLRPVADGTSETESSKYISRVLIASPVNSINSTGIMLVIHGIVRRVRMSLCLGACEFLATVSFKARRCRRDSRGRTFCHNYTRFLLNILITYCLQFFDTVGWATGKHPAHRDICFKTALDGA